jgi:DNA end-binding protein Ku
MDPAELKLPEGEVGKKELTMAESLVETMSDKWEPEKYKDDYREALLQLIQEKIKSGGKELPARKQPQSATNVVDLLSVLQASLEQTGNKAKKTASTSVPSTAHAKTTRKKPAARPAHKKAA